MTRPPIFISWTRENGRSADLAEALGAELHNIYPKGGLLRRYVASIWSSSRIINSMHPEQGAIFMLPPMPLILVARLLRGKNHVRNIYDLHTGFFYDPKWQWATSFSLRLMRGARAIVTNKNLADVCDQNGVRVHVLHDILQPQKVSVCSGPFIVCPVSYSNDEPIERLIQAARDMPQTRWLFTGNAPAAVRSHAPENVEFSGFLSNDAYDEVIGQAAVVVALTNRKDTMQRAGYEAIMRGVPVVTSEFQVLKEFFEDAAVYVAKGEANLEQQLKAAIEGRNRLAERSEIVLGRRIEEQRNELFALRSLLNKVIL